MATGRLVKVNTDDMTIVIKGADDQEQEFRYTDATKVIGAQEQVSGLSTKAGSLVTIHFTQGAATRASPPRCIRHEEVASHRTRRVMQTRRLTSSRRGQARSLSGPGLVVIMRTRAAERQAQQENSGTG